MYVLTVPAADPSAPREAHAAGRRAAAAATGTLGAPPAGATLAAAAPAAAASFGPLLRAQERYAGRVWTVLPHDWLPGAPPDEFPPRSCGPGAAAHQWSARLRGGALRLTLDGEGAAGQVAKVSDWPGGACGGQAKGDASKPLRRAVWQPCATRTKQREPRRRSVARPPPAHTPPRPRRR